MNWRTRALILTALVTTVIGLGGYTFLQAKGFSYFSNDPKACVNCHIMRDQFESWNHSSHKTWATCNDCHMPHDLVGKYFTKARNGWNHSEKFTTGQFPEPIMIGDTNRRITLQNCMRCHQRMVAEMRINLHEDNPVYCTRCHGNVGHQGNT